MALTFDGPESWRWDRQSQEVRLNAWLGSGLILCRVSRKAIEGRCGNSPSPSTCLRAAKEHFDEITARLDDLISRGRFEKDGSVLLRSTDW
jgi:hypothetical protein